MREKIKRVKRVKGRKVKQRKGEKGEKEKEREKKRERRERQLLATSCLYTCQGAAHSSRLLGQHTGAQHSLSDGSQARRNALLP